MKHVLLVEREILGDFFQFAAMCLGMESERQLITFCNIREHKINQGINLKIHVAC